MNSQAVVKTFRVDLDAIFDLYAGFNEYFAKHPEEEKAFFHLKEAKSREMFIGKKTEKFTRLLDALSIELDTVYLEAEYYFTRPSEGEVYKFENGTCSIALDFYIDPTAQIETCAISLSFPKEKEDEIVNIIRELHKDCVYVVPQIYDGDFDAFYNQIRQRDMELASRSNTRFKSLLEAFGKRKNPSVGSPNTSRDKVRTIKLILIPVFLILCMLFYMVFAKPAIAAHSWKLALAQNSETLQVEAHNPEHDFSDDQSGLFANSKPVNLRLEARDGKLIILDLTNNKTYEGTYRVNSRNKFTPQRYSVVIDKHQGTANMDKVFNPTLFVSIDGYYLTFHME